MTPYMAEKSIKELEKLLKDAGDPHPNSNLYQEIQRDFLMRLSYHEGFKDGYRDALSAPKEEKDENKR